MASFYFVIFHGCFWGSLMALIDLILRDNGHHLFPSTSPSVSYCTVTALAALAIAALLAAKASDTQRGGGD